MAKLLVMLICLATPLEACRESSYRSSRSTPQRLTIGPEYTPQIRAIDFQGIDEVWVVSSRGDLLHTANGGTSWETISGNAVGKFAAVSFIDSLRGWAVNDGGRIHGTIDGGQTWRTIAHPRDGEDYISSPEKLVFVDELYGWIQDAFSVWRTEDGGVTWTRCVTTERYQSDLWQPKHSYFFNREVAWVSSDSGLIHHTTDGGRTWHTQRLKSKDIDFRYVQFINEHSGWVYGHDGSIYRSDDGGLNWRPQATIDETVALDAFHFVNPKEGWAVGRRNDPDRKKSQGVILHTTNGGRSWDTTLVSAGDTFFSHVYFTDANNGWLFGRDDAYRSGDGGRTWQLVLSLPPITRVQISKE